MKKTVWKIKGWDNLLDEDYILPEEYATREEAFKRCHSRREYPIKVEK